MIKLISLFFLLHPLVFFLRDLKVRYYVTSIIRLTLFLLACSLAFEAGGAMFLCIL